MHQWLQSTVWWLCPCKHSLSSRWKSMATSKANDAYCILWKLLQTALKRKIYKVKCKMCKIGWLKMCFHVSRVFLHRSQTVEHQLDLGEVHTRVIHTHQASPWLHPYLSMSPWISLLPLWDVSLEEATSEARLAFRAYRWRPPSVRYLSEEDQLEEVDDQFQCDIKKIWAV